MKLEPGMAFNIKKLNKLFAVLSILFFITVIWVFLDDYIKPWKVVQVKSLEIKRQVLDKQAADENKNIDQDKLKELKAEEAKSTQNVESKKVEIEKAQERLVEIDKLIYSQNMINGETGSLAAEWQYKYEQNNGVSGKEIFTANAQKQMNKFKAIF